MKYLIVGLGNIGPEYELTRHNIGFLVLDRWADEEGVKFEMNKLAYTSEVKHKGRTLHLIKPTTYMNLSGKAVNHYLQEHKIPKENMLVITDDIALPYGKIRLKPKGSAGGHNGLKNIEQLTGGANYPRLRFGVGDDFHKGQQVDYVLSPFSKQEMDELVLNMDQAIDAVKSFCTIGLERTMNHFN
ncbi:peptidyl-tRNA hydrolase [Ekhidna lutea]|uniref:Peptidyl-tRNA hydrolase n=1 Tax=Ekhidna lutea TaxID=447679 RepID=A0A239LHU6_EKHLU|nr:aminoacyl-tRNA hydrolase [Ekhidna lutea]SNT30051.1 peptidyl-tRNA hydrolase [Ekhidna lutea]